jgi:CBS domain-containing protein
MRRDLTAIAEGTERSTYVDPDELDSLTRRHLRETFRATAAIQESIANDWRSRIHP